MKILIFYTYNKGLLSEFFQELSEKLSSEGHDVFNYYLKSKKDFFVINDVAIYGDKRAGIFQNYYNIYKIIKQTKPDVVVSNFGYINPAVFFGRLLGVKRNIAWFHTAYEHTKPSKFMVVNKTFYLKLADIVIANSKLLKDEMHHIYKVPVIRTRSIPFWTNIVKYRNSSKPEYINTGSKVHIGCPGRLLENKNHQTVISAIYNLKNEHSANAHLYIAGGGPFITELETLVTSLNLQKNVSFLGVLTVNEMVTFYDSMDVMVLPSLNEAFGLVFIEAIALGRPVIVSSQFGALNFIDTNKFSLDDFTFNPKSVKELQEQLIPYFTNNGRPSEYFEELYRTTFDKQVIYKQIKKTFTNNES